MAAPDRRPLPWESPRSGVGPPAPDRYVRGGGATEGGIGWYRRRVEVPPAWAGDRIWIVVGAAYWRARAWVDGAFAAEHEGGYDPFEIDVTDLVRQTGAFELVIRVDAPADTDEYPHGKNTRHWYSRASGIWQAVFVEPRPAVHVDRLRARTDLEAGTVDVDVVVRAPGPVTARLTVEVLRADRVVAAAEATIRLAAGVAWHHVQALVPSPDPWSPDSPALYAVRVTLATSAGRPDVAETAVGFRTIAFERLGPDGPRWLHLNGRPLYVRAVMSQGYHPDGILAYPDEATIRRDLASAKELGFNMVRLHVKVEDPRVLAWADRLGILLWCEVPDFLTPSAAALARWEGAWRAMLERDAGHPSIVMWCMFIESWGLGINQFGFGGAQHRFAEDPAMQAWVTEMYALGRSLDPTRPIVENSVCEADHTVAEVNDIHLFPSGYGELQATAGATLDAWLAGAYPGSADNFAPGHVQADQPLMVTSMAGWSSVGGVETSWPLRALVNEVRARERIAGYGWVQLYDVEWELTGLQTYDRRPKSLGYDPADVNAEDVLVVRGPLARLVPAGAVIAVDVALAHASGRRHGCLTLGAWLEGLDGSWQPVRTAPVELASAVAVDRYGVIPLGRVETPAPAAPFGGWLRIEAHDARGRLVARTIVQVATSGPDGGRPRADALALPLERWRPDQGVDLDVVAVGGSRQRIAAARLACELPFDAAWASSAQESLLLIAEAAIRDDARRAPRDPEDPAVGIRVLVDGRPVAEVPVPLERADSAGSLSIVHPEGMGRYGGPLRVDLGPLDATPPRRHTLLLEPAEPGPGREVVLFGPLLGRAPLGPELRTARSEAGAAPAARPAACGGGDDG